jgi:hypothetical protein
MHFLSGALLVCSGYYLWSVTCKKPVSKLQRQQDLLMEVRKEKQAEMVMNLHQEKELYYRISVDAINRENRAKNALIKVLTTSGCSEAQIEEVLASIDEG